MARIGTVGADGTPHVVPLGWSYNPDQDTIEVGGFNLTETKKFRDVERHGRAAIVIDDLASRSPWRPHGIEVRGRAEAVGGPEAVIRIHAELALRDVQEACDLMRSTFEASGRCDGYVSLDVDPRRAGEADGMRAEAALVWELVARPNVLVGIPATSSGSSRSRS